MFYYSILVVSKKLFGSSRNPKNSLLQKPIENGKKNLMRTAHASRTVVSRPVGQQFACQRIYQGTLIGHAKSSDLGATNLAVVV